jgi:uncharacterized protein YjbI with pentapeptide repeats
LTVAAIAFTTIVAVDLRVWTTVPWRHVGSVLAGHVVLVGGGAPVAVVALIAAVALVRRRTVASTVVQSGQRWPWPLTYPGIVLIAAVVAVVGVVALVVMLRLADQSTATDRPKLQIDAIKYGLGAFAAAGAAAALLLGVRRQQQTELAQVHTEHDAAERRVTDLYTKAVEQLGHADAAVRLGGLYALERVAQNNPDQRQTVVNVLCAYLRMPYVLPSPQEPEAQRTTAHQEFQVRLTAQRILAAHLTPHPAGDAVDVPPANPGSVAPTFWPDMTINLTGATLGDWYFTGCRVSTAWFDEVTFTGHAWFDDATFTGEALFRRAVFATAAKFQGATFERSARFNKAAFASSAVFSRSTFSGLAWFDGAAFTSDVDFERTAFGNDAWFVAVTFGGKVNFGEASFNGSSAFEKCRFKVVSGGRDVWPVGWQPVSEDGLVGTLAQPDPATSP